MPRHEIVGVSLDGKDADCSCGFRAEMGAMAEHIQQANSPEVKQLKDLGKIIMANWEKKMADKEFRHEMEELNKVVKSEPREEEIVRVLRLVEYEGPRKDVEEQLKNSIHGTRTFPKGVSNSWPKRGLRITSTDLGRFPEVIEEARRVADPQAIKDLNSRIERLEIERDKALAREEEVRSYCQNLEHQRDLAYRQVIELREKLEEKNDFISLMDSELRNLWSDGEVIA